MAINYNAGPMGIGTSYTFVTPTKKIQLPSIPVGGVLTAPSQAFDVLLGDNDGTITSATTISSVSSIVVPGYYVADDFSYAYFDVGLQVNYTTGTTPYRYTTKVRVVVNTPAPAGMTGFQTYANFLPGITSFVAGTPQVQQDAGGVWKLNTKLTMAQFNINATGVTAIEVPLA